MIVFLKNILMEKKIALCYEFQRQNSIPLNPFDIPVNMLITESNVIRYK